MSNEYAWRVWDEAVDDDGSLTVVDAPTAEEAVARFILDHAEAFGLEGEDFGRLYATPVTAALVLGALDAIEEAGTTAAERPTSHDDAHGDGALAAAAAELAWSGSCPVAPGWARDLSRRHDDRRCLAIAAALLLAEIERLDRMEVTRD